MSTKKSTKKTDNQPDKSVKDNRENKDFLKLWGSETLSLFGTQVSVLALPLTAIYLLEAGPAEMGLLGAAQFAPFLLVTLLAGVLVDRIARRPLMVAANLGRAVLLGLIHPCC